VSTLSWLTLKRMCRVVAWNKRTGAE
jgi:hypothetical protein